MRGIGANFELLPRLDLILSEIELIITLKLILAKEVIIFNSVSKWR